MSGNPHSGNPHPPTPSQAGLLRRVSLTIVLVSDLRRSVSFYRDQLGLTLTAETSEWAEFRVGETRLAIQTGGLVIRLRDVLEGGQ